MRVELPASWKDVTIKQFIELAKVKAKSEDEIDMTVEIISVMSGLERQKIAQLGLSDLKKLFTALTFLDSPIPDQCQQRIKVKGVVYYSDFTIENFTAGQYIDLKHFIKGDDVIANIHNILAIFFLPVGKKYNEKPHAEVAEDFLNEVSISVAYPVALFFWSLCAAWMEHIADSLQKQSHETLMEMTLN
jgi:hypothetical protein